MLAVCVLVFIPSLVCEFGHIEPFQRGFFCDDDSIKYPYKDNTVSVWAVAIVGISVPSVVVSCFLLRDAVAEHGR